MEESVLYEPVREYLSHCFSIRGEVHLEITAGGKISERLQKRLDDPALYLLRFEKMIPDIMGYVVTSKSDYGESRELITVEVKQGKPHTRDILQARNYGSAFDANYALLLSTTELPEVVRRLCEKRFTLIQFRGYDRVSYGRFDTAVGRVQFDSWYPKPPFDGWPKDA